MVQPEFWRLYFSLKSLAKSRSRSTVALTDIGGDTTDEYTYGPYGELLDHTGSSETPFLFNGKYGVISDENGLYYMRARYYNPDIKRFINLDVLLGSIDEGQSLNRYAYVNGNPVLYTDPEGQFVWIIAGTAAGFLVGGGADLVVQGITKGWNNINTKEVIVSATAGAATGFIATTGIPLVGAIIGNAAIGAGGYVATQSWNEEPITAKGVLMGTAAGGIGGWIGGSGMLSGSTGKELSKITAASEYAKYLGLKSGQEIASIYKKELLKKAGKTSLARTILGDLAAAFSSIPTSEVVLNK